MLLSELKTASGILLPDSSEAVSTSRRAVSMDIYIKLVLDSYHSLTYNYLQLRASKIPDSEFTTLPNGLKYVQFSSLLYTPRS